MLTGDRQFPAALAAAMAVPFDCDGGGGVDFESFPAFLSVEDTTDWLRAWTGNGELSGDDFRIFGQNGSGGYAAFWLIRVNRALADQPVVFLGSEGETGVVARDLGDFLWLLADGLGPWEAANPYDSDRVPRPDLGHPSCTVTSLPSAPPQRRQWPERSDRSCSSAVLRLEGRGRLPAPGVAR
ncbi:MULTISPECIES: SMI1/KNR4 family protein [unclassified Streptomyces]|uniref:SMI1/KNR4 family protein n=1 Tax=unclassified Streptomyces TaxID=2593676 RepID=UPI001F524717|nr:SMI1/KNR4 family protein [Streptomyces sp. TSRI0107]